MSGPQGLLAILKLCPLEVLESKKNASKGQSQTVEEGRGQRLKVSARQVVTCQTCGENP